MARRPSGLAALDKSSHKDRIRLTGQLALTDPRTSSNSRSASARLLANHQNGCSYAPFSPILESTATVLLWFGIEGVLPLQP